MRASLGENCYETSDDLGASGPHPGTSTGNLYFGHHCSDCFRRSHKLRISGDENNHVYFDGLIDEASVYSRALSAAEIAAIYNAGSAGKCALAPSILVQPQGLAVDPGSSMTFTAPVGGSPPLGYQWQLNHTAIPGATASALTLTNIQASQAGSYLLIVTDAVGSATSSDAVLTVLPPPPCTPPVAGLVSWWPGEGGANDVVSTNNGTLQGGASFAAGLVGQAFNFDPANVTFTVRDSSSNASPCLCTITVADLTPPTILYCLGEWTLGFDANCQALLPDMTGTNFMMATDNCSSVSVTQAPPVLTPMPFGTNTVWLTASDNAGNQTTRAIAVIVPGEPHIALQLAPLTVVASSNTFFSVLVCGIGPLGYHWQHAGTNLPSGTNSILTLSNVKTNDAGDYRVIISNAAGSVTSVVATLTVLRPPVIARQPKSLAAAPGGAASFSVSVQGRTPFAYQWQRGGSPLAGQTKATLALTNVQSEDFGAYKVGITNADGSAFSEVSLLTLAVSPVIASLDFNSQTFMLTVPTELGPTYVVEYKDRLEEGPWTVPTTIAGTGLPIPITDNGLTNTTRFYRVRVR